MEQEHSVPSKKVWGCLKVTNWGWRSKSQKRGSFHRESRFSLCNMLYCETLLQVLLGIYSKRFYWMPLFTILLLFYVFEVGKAKSAIQSALMALTLNELFQKKVFQVLYPPENSMSLALPLSPSLLFVFFYYSVCTVISDWNHPFDTSTFTHTVSEEHIAIENTYLQLL